MCADADGRVARERRSCSAKRSYYAFVISLVRVSFRGLASWSRELQESGRCCVPYSITELSFGPGLENVSMRSSSTGAVEAQVFRALECCTSWCSRRSARAFHVDQVAKVDRKNAFHQLRRTTYKNASTAGSATDLLLSSSKGRFLPCKSQCKSMRSFGSTAGSSYITLAEPVLQHTVEIKRSKFIASAAPVDDEGAALAFLSQVLLPTTTSLHVLLRFLHILHIVFDDFIIALISLQSIYPYVCVHVISMMETLLCIFYTCMCCSSTLHVEGCFQFCSRDRVHLCTSPVCVRRNT